MTPVDNPPMHVETHVTTWQGPLPPPDALAAYESLIKGAAERLLTLAEEEARSRMGIAEATSAANAADMKLSHARITRGQYLGTAVALAFCAGSVGCAYLGQSAASVALAGATIVGLVNALVNPRRK